jgi:uncharacterized membrane protein YeaQ/YmgE (transglycosylase-associated protein family)
MNDAIKQAKIQAKAAENIATMGLIKDIISNPIVELVGGFMLIQALTEVTDKTKRPLVQMGTDTQIVLRAGIVGAVTAQQLGGDNTKELITNAAGSLTKLLPALIGG